MSKEPVSVVASGIMTIMVILWITLRAMALESFDGSRDGEKEDEDAPVLESTMFFNPFDNKNLQKNEMDWTKADHKSMMKRLEDDVRKQIAGNFSTPFSMFNRHAPAKKASDTVVVHLWFHLHRIKHIDEKRQSVDLVGGIHLYWNDSYIRWNPRDYRNISHITFHPFGMWIPPLHSSAEIKTRREPLPMVDILSSGRCMFHTSVRMRLLCMDMDYSNFPYDTHTCKIFFYLNQMSNWHLPGIHLKFADSSLFHNMPRDLMEMVHPGMMKNVSLEWHIMDHWRNNGTVHDSASGKVVWSYLEYWFQYRRNAPFHGLVCTLPVILGSLCLILMFSYPLGSTTRLSVALGSFIFLSMVFERVFQYLPPVSNTIPKIVRFYGLLFSLGLMSVLETVVLGRGCLARAERALAPPPRLVQVVIGFLSGLLCYYRPALTEEFVPENYVELVESDQSAKSVGDEEGGRVEVSCRPGQVTWVDVLRVMDSLVFAVFSLIILIGIFALLI